MIRDLFKFPLGVADYTKADLFPKSVILKKYERPRMTGGLHVPDNVKTTVHSSPVWEVVAYGVDAPSIRPSLHLGALCQFLFGAQDALDPQVKLIEVSAEDLRSIWKAEQLAPSEGMV